MCEVPNLDEAIGTILIVLFPNIFDTVRVGDLLEKYLVIGAVVVQPVRKCNVLYIIEQR